MERERESVCEVCIWVCLDWVQCWPEKLCVSVCSLCIGMFGLDFKERFLAITGEDGFKSKNVKRQKSLKIGQRFHIPNFVLIG